jgi:NDP-sugar pyrophosphorylase family protein
MLSGRLMQPTLVVLAAGLGSRYGGLKQLDPVGPDGATIMEYSIYDAARAGFGKVVFVIRRSFAEAFRRDIGARAERRLAVDYAFQELDDVPSWFSRPPEREKPWGTGHAVLAARSLVHEPFASINADDFYGRDGFEQMARYLGAARDGERLDCAMVGYVLRSTLSDHGSVARGICQLDADSRLRTVVEHLKIERDGNAAVDRGADGDRRLTGDELVSMNFWGFSPALFGALEEGFERFLRREGARPKSEYLLPSVVDDLIRARKIDVKVLPTTSSWFGVTYPDDKPRVMESVRALIASGAYPASLRDA